MKRIIILLLIATPAHSQTDFFIEAGIGENRGNWENCSEHGSVFGFGFRSRLYKHWEVEGGFDHYSQSLCNFGKYEQKESYLNHWGLKVRYVF